MYWRVQLAIELNTTNHSNDAVIVKRFHLWGRKAGVPTSTIHDAFFTNAAQVYADMISRNVIKQTLDEMRARGLPKELYDQYLDEAIDKGLIPVPGRSVIGGKVLKLVDILTEDDVLKAIPKGFEKDLGWYGIG